MRLRQLALGASLAALAGCGFASDEDALSGTTGPEGTSTPSEEGGGEVAGTLTAGVWDDNRNYDFFLEYVAEQAELSPGVPPFTQEERDEAQARSLAAPSGRTLLDVALVIDTTGSMSDELSYLQTEFDALSSQIDSRYPHAEQRWALVVYRDQGDQYVVRSFAFTTDLDAFRQDLEAQSAGGGGNYPEAPDEGLAAALELGWRDQSTARLLFWLADAPHHDPQAERMVDLVRDARGRDIHIYPVAASGTDELTELTMRSAAQLTLGRYLFLTDDSGVGNPHKEPSIPCYFVTRLDHAILRMVDIEMTGIYREPAPDQILRTGGEPTDGICELADGSQVSVF